MPNPVIVIGAPPHMKLSRSGHGFTAVDALIIFGSHEPPMLSCSACR